MLRTSFPTAHTVLYMWDSTENRRGVVENLPLFDVTFSFDPESARRYGMHLRPLFFSRDFERPPRDDPDFHVSFIGANATIYHQVTLGAIEADFRFDPSKRPVVVDEVTLTAGAKVLVPFDWDAASRSVPMRWCSRTFHRERRPWACRRESSIK